MIKMNLQMFAKTTAYQQERRKAVAILKQQKLQDELNQRKDEEEKPKKASPLSNPENIINSEKISKNEVYLLIKIENGKAAGYIERTGDELKDSIAYEKLVLDKKSRVWKTAKGTVFIIRRKR